MEPGVIPDTWNAVQTDRSAWVAGLPEESTWRGLKLTGKLAYPIVSFRCSRCGLLKEYAFRPSQRLG